MPSKSRNRVTRAGTVASPAVSVTVSAAEANPIVAVIEDDPPVDTPQWAELYERAFARYQEQRERVYREQEDNRRLWEEFLRAQGEQVPEGDRSLVASDELHERLLQLAATAGHEYQRENVIGDPNQTFGIEIEFEGGNPTTIARALYDAGLASSPRQERYHSGARRPGMWTVETDATVTGEVVSPVLRDTPETWAQLERVCSVLTAHGAHVSTSTGAHVHVGVDSSGLDHDVNRFRRVASVCAWAEDLMYRLSAGSGPDGRRHRGAANRYTWCGPMGSGSFENVRTLPELVDRVGATHGVGLNYANITGRRRTVEYRYFDSSLDPARLQANIQLACWLTRRAGELPDSAIPRERVPLGSNRGAADQRQGEHLLRRFADLVFVRPQERLRLYWLFQRSAWQPGTRAA
jgi:Putative amidoligase enzyme